MITRVHFKNYRAFKDIEATLEPFTVVVGPNGCGKTSLLRSIDDWSKYAKQNLAAVELSGNKHIGMTDFCLSAETNFGVISIGVENGSVFHHPTPNSPDVKSHQLRFKVSEARFIKIDESTLLRPSTLVDNPQIGDDGSGLATWFSQQVNRKTEIAPLLIGVLKQVVPSFEDLRCDVTRNGFELLFDMKGAKGLRSSQVSQGTLFATVVLGILVSENSPRILLLDDLDQCLHPKAQGDLIGVLRKIMAEKPELQILSTTHSPYLLDHLSPHEVRLMTLNTDGHPICGKLTEHPDFEKWKDEMSPGELWSLWGESWLTQAAKTPG